MNASMTPEQSRCCSWLWCCLSGSGQFRPDALPILRAKVTAGNRAIRDLLDLDRTFNRNGTNAGMPLTHQRSGNFQTAGERTNRLGSLDVGFEVHAPYDSGALNQMQAMRYHLSLASCYLMSE